MRLLAKPGHVFRAAAEGHDDVFVLGETLRTTFPADASVATVADILSAAERRAAGIIAAAEARGEAILAGAMAAVSTVRAAAHAEGLSAGHDEAESEIRELIELVRTAAREGKA